MLRNGIGADALTVARRRDARSESPPSMASLAKPTRQEAPFADSTTASRRLPKGPDHGGGLTPQPEPLRFLSNTAIILCSQQIARFGLIEMRGATGNKTPRHVHRVETEGFFVLAGALRLQIGDRTVRLGQGQSTLAEPGVPHTLVVESGDPARWLVVTNGDFDRFVATVAAGDHTLPSDPESLKYVAARFGIDIIDSTPATATIPTRPDEHSTTANPGTLPPRPSLGLSPESALLDRRGG
jgi:quercetin dioxygenase-like cupin family protein